MFGWFRKTPPQKIRPEAVRILCERHLEEVLQQAQKDRRSDGRVRIVWTQMMLHDVELVNMWRRHFYPRINETLETPDIASQRVAIRKFLLDTTEYAAPHRAFLWTGITADHVREGDERAILMRVWDKDTSDLEDATFTHLTYLTITDCSIEMIRYLQGIVPEISDNNPNDYFEHFRSLVTQIWYITAENNVALSNGGSYWMEPFRAPLKKKLALVRADAMTGTDVRYEQEEPSTEEDAEPDNDSGS